MHDCSAHAVNRIVAFLCPPAVKTAFKAPDPWFKTLEGKNFLIYRPNPGEYTRIREGDSTKFERTVSRKRVNVRLRDAGFSLDIKVDDIRFRYLLEELAESCMSSAYDRFTPITVLDYVDPGRVAFKAAVGNNSNPYQKRFGLIEIEASSGFNGRGSQLYGVDGFRLIFRDDKGVLV